MYIPIGFILIKKILFTLYRAPPPCSRFSLIACCFILLTACTSEGGDNITLNAGSQGSDPGVLDIPIAYIKRPIPAADEDAPDLRNPLAFNPGAQLYIRSRSEISANEINVTEQILSIVAAEEGTSTEQLAIDIKDLESSFDGKRLIFAARVVPEPVNANLEFTSWNIWLFDFDSREANYLITSRVKRNEGIDHGGGQDIAPHFLTDDRIVLSSTRQVATAGKQLNDGRAQIYAGLTENRQGPAAVLHIYDPSLGAEVFKQISFNQSHDLDPVTLASGEIVFSRWNNSPGNNHLSLYKINPSGRGLSLVYGHHSRAIGSDGSNAEFSQTRELNDGRLMSLIKPFQSATLGGNIVIIDSDNYVEFDQPTWNQQGLGGTGHQTLNTADIRTDGEISAGGQYASFYPLQDGSNRMLLSWSPCRVIDNDDNFVPCTLGPVDALIAPPLYGAWIYDPAEGTQLPVVLAEEGFAISEIVAGEPRAYPRLLDDIASFNSELALSDKGALIIDSVYDFDGVDNSILGIAQQSVMGSSAHSNRIARFLRVVKPVPIPDNDIFDVPNSAFGVSAAQSMREIIGYTLIEADGSVAVRVPANTPLMISVLDINGRRISERHDFWLQVSAGEIVHCTGCHTGNSEQPHGRQDSMPTSSNPGAISLPSGALGFSNMDTAVFCGTEIGQTMAKVFGLRRPDCAENRIGRDLSLQLTYRDEWSDALTVPDMSLDYSYDPAWTDIADERAIIVDNLDPALDSRIVINYIDHIQPIWERIRTGVDDGSGTLIDSCIGCHSTQSDTVVPPGQLELGSEPSDINSDHYRSYRELLNADDEQWLNTANTLANRQRECSDVDAQGNPLNFTSTVSVQATMSVSGANNSSRFFNCFNGGNCGPNPAPALPGNCSEDGGTAVTATMNSIDHRGMLSDSELRLISEWLDIGAQYYNNPFDPRLAP